MMIHVITGFDCPAGGDCLGMRPLVAANYPGGLLAATFHNYYDLNSQCMQYGKYVITAQKTAIADGDDFICHSYGGGWLKRFLDRWKGIVTARRVLWLDPVKDFWIGQYRFPFDLFQWSMPPMGEEAVCIYQSLLPPTGCPFKSAKNLSQVNVTNLGLDHVEIPSSTMVLKIFQALFSEPLETPEKLT